MKVLLFSNDLMPFGNLPTSGGGLRCWQLMKGLEAHGIEVVASMPGFTYLAEKHYHQIPKAQQELLWRWETQDQILRRTKPDAVLFASNWDHFGLSRAPDCPLIIDLHGSRLIETSMWNTPVSTDRKVEIFSKADCLLCAGTRQRSYFYGWLVQAGRVPDAEHLIRYIPVSMSPDTPEHAYPDPAEDSTPFFVSGGGWFPWQNQAKAIFAVCNEISRRQRGMIEIYGTPHETQNLSAEERSIREIYAQVRDLAARSSRVKVQGYVGRDDLISVYRRASVALEAMRYNLERELAFTTRTVEYLWCGLPVLYNDFAELSDHIRDYDAGWTVNPEDDLQIQAAIEEIFARPDIVAEKGRNAQRLVRERLAWDTTIMPLVEFLREPKKLPAVQPAIGPVCARASYLSPGGTTVDLPLSPGTALSQRFIMPAENIYTVELSYALARAEDRSSVRALEVKLAAPDGKRIVRKVFKLDSLSESGRLSIEFPLWRRPTGGQQFILTVAVHGGAEAPSGTVPVVLRGLLQAGYPFVKSETEIRGRTLLGQEITADALALTFVPAAGKLYRLKAVFQRAAWMLRNGEWQRLYRAAARRVPALVHRVRHAFTL